MPVYISHESKDLEDDPTHYLLPEVIIRRVLAPPPESEGTFLLWETKSRQLVGRYLALAPTARHVILVDHMPGATPAASAAVVKNVATDTSAYPCTPEQAEEAVGCAGRGVPMWVPCGRTGPASG